MSLTRSQSTRRLSLMTGSALVIASVASIASTSLLLTPGVAYAYDECTPVAGSGTLSDGQNGVSDPSLNGAAADTFVCTGSGRPITYTPQGALTVTTSFSSNIGTSGTAVRISQGSGDVILTNAGGTFDGQAWRGGGTTAWAVDLGAAAGTTITLKLTGASARILGNDVSETSPSTQISGQVLRATGAGALVVNNARTIRGRFDLSGLSGGSTLNITGEGYWDTAGATLLSSGADLLSVGPDAFVFTGLRTSETAVENVAATIDFGGGTDTFSNAGYFVVHPNPDQSGFGPETFEAETLVLNLENFDNSGVIILGGLASRSRPGGSVERARQSDGAYDDILSMPGTTFTGSGDSRIVFDVNLNAPAAQSACDPGLRNVDGDMPAADCVLLAGGETAGLTLVTINDILSGGRGAFNPDGVVLIDVAGGASAAEHFALDPENANYSTEAGGIIDKGVFFYALAYDDDTQQHKLVGLPGANALQFPLLTQAAHGLWRTSTGSWLDRQADLRGQQDDGVGGSVWLRGSGETSDRDVTQDVSGSGATFTFDNTFEQTSYAITGGVDLLSGDGGESAWVVGLMAGYAHADVDYDASPNTASYDGSVGGVYASLISGGLFVDAMVSANKLILKTDMPGIGLAPAGTILDTNLLSLGAQLEAGWRFALTEALFVEPLAALSYVRTKYDDLDIPADDPSRPRVIVEFDDPASFRGSLGARLGMDQDFGGLRTQLSILGRVSEEFDGEADMILHNLGSNAPVSNEFSGRFAEFGVGVNLFGLGEALSGFVNFGGKFGDDYTSQNLSAGVRVAW